jgi:pSer/pThr/pTyr-binding forkhead associated (FHA) protein
MTSPNLPAARLRLPSGDYLLYPGQQVKLGRANDNDIVLNDPKVSRSHALIEWNGSGFVLRDLNSANGTYVNTTRLAGATRLLRDGDEIALSQQVLTYEIVRAEQPGISGDSAPVGPFSVESHAPCLVVTAGPDTGRAYPLWGETITIGRESRDATWEIRLTDRSVSRPHARLELGEEGYMLVDLESANGTQVNGKLLKEPLQVRNGDVIAVGETQLVFHHG